MWVEPLDDPAYGLMVFDFPTMIDMPQVIVVSDFGNAVGLKSDIIEGEEYAQNSFVKDRSCDEYSNGNIQWADQNIGEFEWDEQPWSQMPEQLAAEVSNGVYLPAVIEFSNYVFLCGGADISCYAQLRLQDGRKFILRNYRLYLTNQGRVGMNYE